VVIVFIRFVFLIFMFFCGCDSVVYWYLAAHSWFVFEAIMGHPLEP
jgi:hypothetical protein